MTRLAAADAEGVYRRLYEVYGPQAWWPGDTAFEIMAGAILVQNTAWTNAARAIANLGAARALDASAILALGQERIAELIRPAGYFNVKAQRLLAYCQAYVDAGELAALGGLSTAELRAWLLGIKGIGPETADAVLLYAFERPSFVIDAYARRIFGRLGLVEGDEPYEALRQALQDALGEDVPVFNEYHALLVQLGQLHCRPKPRCSGCPLAEICVGMTAMAAAPK